MKKIKVLTVALCSSLLWCGSIAAGAFEQGALSAKPVSYRLSYVQVLDPTHHMGEVKINAFLRSLTEDYYGQAQKTIKAVEGELVGPARWEFLIKNTETSIDDQYRTIEVTTYQYTGGAHGTSHLTAYLFDRNTGIPVDIGAYTHYESLDKERLIAQLEATAAKRQLPLFPDGIRELLLKPGYVPTLTIRQGMPMIVFNQYEVAPYSSGIIVLPLLPIKDQ